MCPSWLGGFLPVGATSTPPPPTPPVPGYDLWLDANYAGNTDSDWVDQSGNGYDATGGSGWAIVPDAVNGLSAYQNSDPADYPGMVTPAYS
jgi:hypothetical protein